MASLDCKIRVVMQFRWWFWIAFWIAISLFWALRICRCRVTDEQYDSLAGWFAQHAVTYKLKP